MKKKILLSIAILALIMAVGATASYATCGQYGKIYYTYSRTTYEYIYITPRTSFPTYYYYFYTNDADFRSQAHAQMAAGNTVYVVGNATSCPTSGAARYGGAIQTIYTFRNL